VSPEVYQSYVLPTPDLGGLWDSMLYAWSGVVVPFFEYYRVPSILTMIVGVYVAIWVIGWLRRA